MCSQCRGSSSGGAHDGTDDDAVSVLLLLLVVHSGIHIAAISCVLRVCSSQTLVFTVFLSFCCGPDV